jgi:hypothetical protein
MLCSANHNFLALTSIFGGSSFSGSGFFGSGSGAFSSVSSIWLMFPVAGRDRVPPLDKEDLGRVLYHQNNAE